MVKSTAIIQNAAGIHVRPSGVIADKIGSYSGSVCFLCEGKRQLFTSVLDIIALGLQRGDTINIEVSGKQEKEFLSTLIQLFETHFDFPPRTE